MTNPSPPETETIVARATAAGQGGIGVVRLSGPGARAIGVALCGSLPQPRRAALRRFRDRDGALLDHGVVLLFPAPASFTGEDVVELQGHGGPVVIETLIEACVAAGARRARAGEFSERAFLNDRLDLAQAEAVADLIAAGSRAQARAAMRSLQGEFSRRVEAVQGQLTALRVQAEAALDFPDEDIDLLAEGALDRAFEQLSHAVQALLVAARRGQQLRDGAVVVLAGRPNAGKSSLFNCLAGADRAIVTAQPGTTRDTLSQTVSLDGLAVELIDTAGLRESADPIEREGVRRARAALATADAVLLVIDASAALHEEDRATLAAMADRALLVVLNKTDLGTTIDAGVLSAPAVAVSARDGRGLTALRTALGKLLGHGALAAGSFSARQRHVDKLCTAAEHLNRAGEWLGHSRRGQCGGEFFAEELRAVQQQLGELTGAVNADQLLGEIFSRFCIGK